MKRFMLIALLVLAGVVAIRPGARRSPATWLGTALRRARCGDARSAANDPILSALPAFELSSPAFADGTPLPAPYVDAPALQPPLQWQGVPAGAVELALIVEDIDVPMRAPLVHAIAYGIDPASGTLAAGAIRRIGHPDEGDSTLAVGRGAGGQHFLPPTPIPGHGPHHYVFEAFAVRERLHFDRPPNKRQLLTALRKVAIARAILVGTHEKP